VVICPLLGSPFPKTETAAALFYRRLFEDESFGALDPATLRICLKTALDRARTLMVIAHP